MDLSLEKHIPLNHSTGTFDDPRHLNAELEEIAKGCEKHIAVLRSNIASKIVKKTFYIVLEIFFYALFLISLVGFFYLLSLNPITYSKELTEQVTVQVHVDIKIVNQILWTVRILAFLISLTFLAIGRLIARIRKKYNAINECVDFLQSIVERNKRPNLSQP